jgi:hypothetical protein
VWPNYTPRPKLTIAERLAHAHHSRKNAANFSSSNALNGNVAMRALDLFTDRVCVFEKGETPAGFADRVSAINALINEIRETAWVTPLERTEAQRLVIRLEKLLWKDERRTRRPPI